MSTVVPKDDDMEVRNRTKPPTIVSEISKQKEELTQIENPSNESTTSEHSVTMAQKICEQLRMKIIQELDDQLKVSIESAVDRILEKSESANLMQSSNWLKENMSDKLPFSSSETWLPEKKFIHRNSTLTDLFKISHIETVYHIFVAILLVFCVNTVLSDIVEIGGLVHIYHLELFLWVFKGMHLVFNCWLAMFGCTSLVVYLTFMFWATHRQPISKITNFDKLFLCLYLIYLTAFLLLPAVFIYLHDIAPATTLIVSLEQIRMLMKSHAFVRTNMEKAFIPPENVKAHLSTRHRNANTNERFPEVFHGDGLPSTTTDEELSMSNGFGLPPFSNYLYFLFAPTLVYKSSYPRTPYVRWKVVFFNLVQVGLCIIYTYFIFARFCFSHFNKFGRSQNFHFSLRQLVVSSFGCMLPGALVMLITFYAFLHCWLNAFAELLRFGDRLFYKDWWNSVTFSAYYRGWNVVVHDWLYTYIYRDVYAVCKRYRRMTAQTAVFLLSAIVHEYILTVVFRFFYPVLFVIFGGVGFGIGHLKGRSKLWNIGIWTSLFMGMGILMCLYSMEWYARSNCPPIPDSPILDKFVPRSWFCQQI